MGLYKRVLLSSCKYSWCILFIGFTTGCLDLPKAEKPADLIGEQAMGTIIADVLLLESYTSLKSPELEGRNAEVMLQYNYPLIDKKYHLADSQFIRSYQYYLNDPQALTRIFQGALDTLNLVQEKMSLVSNPDSIK
jgi:hypothetical protein